MTKSKWSEKRVDSDDYFAKKLKHLFCKKTVTLKKQTQSDGKPCTVDKVLISKISRFKYTLGSYIDDVTL